MSPLRWPQRFHWRNGLRLALAAPFVAVALRARPAGFNDGANSALDQQATAVHWGSSQLSFVGEIFPPLPVAVAAVLPGRLSLAIVGALLAGVVLELLGSRLAGRQLSLPLIILLLATFGCSPGFAMVATTDLRSFMALTFLALALEGFLRFAFRGETHGGFQAGLALGLASLCDPVAMVCAAGFAGAAPLIANHRYRGQEAAGRATAAVLLFPTIAGSLGWTFLCWRFAGDAFVWIREAEPGLALNLHTGHLLLAGATGLVKPLLLTPIYALAVVLMLHRRRLAPTCGLLLPPLCAVLARGLGLSFSGLWLAVLLGIVGIVSLPRKPSPTITRWVVGAGVLGLVLKWSVPASAAMHAWQQAVR